jgi:hypothetical protein
MHHELFLDRAVPSKLTEAVVPMTCTREVLSSKLNTETIITEGFDDSSSAFLNRYLDNSSIQAVFTTHRHWFFTEPHKSNSHCVRNFRLPSRWQLDLRSSGALLILVVGYQRFGITCRSHSSKMDGTDRLSRNVGNSILVYAE